MPIYVDGVEQGAGAGEGGGGGGGGGASPTGSVYWEWNGIDTSQFSAANNYKTDLNTGGTGTSALTVVAAPFGGVNALRLTGTTVGGGSFHPIGNLPGGVLPARYAVEYMYASFVLSSGQGGPSFVLFASDTAGTIDGVTYSTSSGATGNDMGLIYDDQQETSTSLFAGDTFSAANVSRGIKYHTECWRQAGTSPHAWWVGLTSMGRSNQHQGSASSVSDGTAAAARFAGKNMNLIGPGLYSGGAAFTGSVDIVGLRIIDLT